MTDSLAQLDLEGALNPAQRQAATAPAGAHLVVAGAGTGKTRTLIYRVAWLVARGEAPESILLLTFTRRAAREMLRRAAGLFDARCERVAGGTFHGFAYQVLRRWAPLLGYQERFTILDRGDAGDLMAVVRAESGFVGKGRRFPRKDTLLDLWSSRVNTGRKLEALIEERCPQFADEHQAIATIHERYTARKKQQNVMDYDDLLINLRDVMARHDAPRAKLGATYRTILIDEYQDTNRLQAHIGALLAAGHGNLMVVGDEAQSIYGFRGASFRNIVDFTTLFPDARTTVLEENYRSTQTILDLANAILAQAREGFDKRLRSHVPGDEKPILVRTDDEQAQAVYVAERVLALREEGVPLDSMAVLARAAWHTNALELELARRNLPFRKFGGIRFTEAAHVKDVAALLKLALNPRDAAAWFRVLQLFDGIGPKAAQRIGSEVIDAGGDLEALSAPHLERRRYGRTLQNLATKIGELAQASVPLGTRLESAIDWYKTLARKRFDDAARRERDLEAMLVIGQAYRELDTFLSDLAIDAPDFTRSDQAVDAEDELLTLSTIHSAKGLEWHTVFVLDLVDGHLPSFAAKGDGDAMEEERRLLYVAITRARRNLYLMRPETVSRRGSYRSQVTELCPFLQELDQLDRLTEIRTYSPQPEEPAWGNGEAAGDPELLKRIQAYFGDD